MTATLTPARTAPNIWSRILENREVLVLPVMMAVALIVFSLGSDRFLTVDNLTNVARQTVFLLIIAIGQMVVMVTGGMDLSVGANVSLTSVVGAMVMAAVYAAMPGQPWLALWAGLGAGMVVGLAIGVANGLGVTLLKINPFMMTLGVSSIVAGVSLYVSGGRPIYGIPPLHGETFGFGRLFSSEFFSGIPIPSAVAVLLVLLAWFTMEWTRFGRHLYATGGNERAAALSGVRTVPTRIAAYMICGLMASLSGLLLTARLGTGETSVGASYPLESIAACVISGVTLSGGRGRTLAVVVGTLLISLVGNGLNLMRVGAYGQSIAIGAILVFAMALSRR